MKRIFLYLLTNIAVLLVLSISLRLLGVDRLLARSSSGLDLQALVVFAAIIGMGGSFVSLAISKWSARHLTGAVGIATPATATERWLVDTVHRHARVAGIGMPEVAVYESSEMNAFATGMSRDNALVAVSTGLLQRMERHQVEAVLGHEISHVANGDMVTLALIQGVVNTFVIVVSRVVGYAVDRSVFRTGHGHGPGFWIAVIVAQLVLGMLASLIVLWFSRRREFRADTGGARLAGRVNMIAALESLRVGASGEHLPDQLAAFGIAGGIGYGMKRLFMTHPPLEERIAALRDAGR